MKSFHWHLMTICKLMIALPLVFSSAAQGDDRGGSSGSGTGSGQYGQPSEPPRATTPGMTSDPTAMRLNAQLLGPGGEVLSPAEPGGAISTQDARMRVDVQGFQIVDPALTSGGRMPGQGHLLYRVNGQPVMISTTATDLAFRNLGTGPHTIDVMLVSSDGTPLGVQQQVRLTGVDAVTPRTETVNPKTGTAGIPKELQNARVNARLVSMNERAGMRQAAVEADITGVPGGTAQMATPPRFLYSIDNGPIIATSQRRLSFHDLPPGRHTVKVGLETADNVTIGPSKTLDLTIPESGSAGKTQ